MVIMVLLGCIITISRPASTFLTTAWSSAASEHNTFGSCDCWWYLEVWWMLSFVVHRMTACNHWKYAGHTLFGAVKCTHSRPLGFLTTAPAFAAIEECVDGVRFDAALSELWWIPHWVNEWKFLLFPRGDYKGNLEPNSK